MAVVLFGLTNLLIPLFLVELFPFSRAPMFADAPQLYCDYAIYTPDGTRLSEIDFGLQRNYWGNPIGVGVGFRPRPTLDNFGEVADSDQVTKQIMKGLARFPDLPFVDVNQEVIGSVDSDHVGPLQEHRWRVHNPHFKEAATP
jgi:hypothetical protein